MKKHIALPILIMLAMVSKAQTEINLKAGINFFNIVGKDENGNETNNELQTGFHAGFTADFPMTRSIYIQPGIFYSQKGASVSNYRYMGNTWNGNVKLNYIEIPLNVVYKSALGTGKLVLGAGPYAGFGIGGSADVNGSNYEVEFNKNVSSTDINQTPFHYKPFDAGLNMLAGYEFGRKLSVQLNTQLGLINNNATFNGQNTGEGKNTGFGVSIGYRLK